MGTDLGLKRSCYSAWLHQYWFHQAVSVVPACNKLSLMGMTVIKRHKEKEVVLDDGTFSIAHHFYCYSLNIGTVCVYWSCVWVVGGMTILANQSFNFHPFNPNFLLTPQSVGQKSHRLYWGRSIPGTSRVGGFVSNMHAFSLRHTHTHTRLAYYPSKDFPLIEIIKATLPFRFFKCRW